ncbi:hypothetical protein [Eubacterium limosum]|uniref:hypothetical protein n=1 Tax=Eubacterium limosum TaxID=1736 RepID=UPI003717BE3A
MPGAANFVEELVTDQAKLVVDNIALYEAWANEYPYPTFEEIYIPGSKFMYMIHDLGAILNGRMPGRERDDQIVLYSVGGIPLDDMGWGKEIYGYAKDHHIGAGLNLWEKPYLFQIKFIKKRQQPQLLSLGFIYVTMILKLVKKGINEHKFPTAYNTSYTQLERVLIVL